MKSDGRRCNLYGLPVGCIWPKSGAEVPRPANACTCCLGRLAVEEDPRDDGERWWSSPSRRQVRGRDTVESRTVFHGASERVKMKEGWKRIESLNEPASAEGATSVRPINVQQTLDCCFFALSSSASQPRTLQDNASSTWAVRAFSTSSLASQVVSMSLDSSAYRSGLTVKSLVPLYKFRSAICGG